MASTAILKQVRISPQKARLVADQVRGLAVAKAISTLEFSNRKGAVIIKKVLESAIANAEHNEGSDIDMLSVVDIQVGQGMFMKRIMPRARGRADRILKRASHIKITVGEAKKVKGAR